LAKPDFPCFACRNGECRDVGQHRRQRQKHRLQSAYIAGRRSRDVIVARFRASRGTYLDVIAAEDAYFDNATAYVQALMELDAARYVLLSRTGGLLDVLRIEPDQLGAKRG